MKNPLKRTLSQAVLLSSSDSSSENLFEESDSGSGELDDVMDSALEALEPIRVGKDVWIPLAGRKVRGKYYLTCKELTKTAFGLDLQGISVTNPEEGSVFP